MRVMVTIEPQMYREVLAGSLRLHRPEIEVVDGAFGELRGGPADFAPDLLLHDDMDEDFLGDWCDVARIEMLYNDSLSARIVVGGRVRKRQDIGVDGLLGVVDEVEQVVAARARS